MGAEDYCLAYSMYRIKDLAIGQKIKMRSHVADLTCKNDHHKVRVPFLQLTVMAETRLFPVLGC